MYGRKLKTVRTNLGLTQQEFAEALDVPQTTYSGYERGTNEPPVDVLKKVCSLYDVDSSWLLDLKRTDYRELLINQYDDYADLISMGFSPDEACRWEKEQFDKYGDMIMKLNYDDRKRVVEFVNQIRKEHEEE